MKSVLFALLSLTTFATAQEAPAQPTSAPVEQSMGYVGLGLGPFPLPLPNFSLGFRTQHNHHGFDLSLQAATVVELTAVKLNPVYLHYFKPNLSSQFYVGGGLGVGALFHHRTAGFISPELVLGKQYQNESQDTRFFQAQISFPTIGSHHLGTRGLSKHNVTWFPLVVLSYGLGF